jgi:hypothetical protein
MNVSTRRQCFQICESIGSKHGCHKAGVTIEGDFTSLLSHKDPNTKTGVNKGRGIQQISQVKQTNKHKNSRCDNLFFFFEKHKMSHHSGTITSRSSNIQYSFHNMYLIIRVTSTQRLTHNNIINIVKDTSKTTVNYNKRTINMSICLRLLHSY